MVWPNFYRHVTQMQSQEAAAVSIPDSQVPMATQVCKRPS